MELNDRLPPPPRCQPNTAPMRAAHSLNSITRDNTNTVLGSKYKLCESVVKNMEKVLASPLQSENLQILWWREQKSADFLSASAAAEQPSEQIWPDMSLRQPKIQTEASKFTLSERRPTSSFLGSLFSPWSLIFDGVTQQAQTPKSYMFIWMNLC